MLFKNREEAGKILAQRLAGYKNQRPVILAVSKGALPMGRVIADVLRAELDVILVKKIGAPNDPELVIGILSEFGELSLTEMALGLSRSFIESRVKAELTKLRHQRKQYSAWRPQVDLKGKTAIIIDEGIATGETVSAVIKSVRHQNPAKITVAAIVSTPEITDRLKEECDDVVSLYAPILYHPVDTYFEKFPQVTSREVREILVGENRGRRSFERQAEAIAL